MRAYTPSENSHAKVEHVPNNERGKREATETFTAPPGLSRYKAFRPHPTYPERPLDYLAEAIQQNEKLLEYAKEARAHYRKIAVATTDADRQKAEHDYKSFKRNLPAVTPSGTFSPARKAEMLVQHSGLVVIDFDALDDVAQCKNALAALPCVALVFISPSGKGVKPFVAVDPIPANDAEHKLAFQAVERFLQDQGLPVKLMKEGGNRDSGQTDVTRLCYIVGDPEAFFRWPVPKPVTWDRSGLQKLAHHPAPPSSGHGDTSWVPAALNAIDPSSLSYEEWLIVGMALHDAQSEGAISGGLELWQTWSRNDKRHRPDDCKKRWEGFTPGKGRTLGTLRHMARSRGWDPPPAGIADEPPTVHLPHGPLEEKQLNKLKKDEGTLQYVDECERWMIQCARDLLIETYRETDEGTSQRPYLLDNRGIWQRDEGKIKESFHATVRGYAFATLDYDVKVRRHYRALLKGQEKKVIANAGAVTQSWKKSDPASLSELTEAETGQLDAAGRYLGCHNGVVDLKTGKLLNRSDARLHLVTRSTGITYDSAARHDAVDKLTSHLDRDAAEYLWRVLGRALWASPAKAFFFLLGPRDSGKTTLALAIRKALGEEAGEFSSDALRQERGAKTGPTPERRALIEQRIVIGSEAEDWKISPAKLKTFSGGGDRIAYQPKYQAERTATVRATIFLIANKSPLLGLSDMAVVDRFRVIPYERPETRDPTVKDVFREEGNTQAAQALLAKLIHFAGISLPGVELHVPPSVEAKIKECVGEERGAFGAWLDAAVVETGEIYDRVSTAELWERWAEYNEEINLNSKTIGGVARLVASKALKDKLQVNFEMVRYNQRVSRGVKGYRLRSPEDVKAQLDAPLGKAQSTVVK